MQFEWFVGKKSTYHRDFQVNSPHKMLLDASVQSEIHPQHKKANEKPDIYKVDNGNSYEFQQKPVKFWSYTDVADWLSFNGFDRYSHLIAFEHKVIVHSKKKKLKLISLQ